MAIASLGVNGTGTFSVTGGATTTFTSVGVGKFANMAAPLSEPQTMTIESTLSGDTGKDSSYLIKSEWYLPAPAGAPFGTPDSKLQVHSVIKGDTSVFTEAQILEAVKRQGHLLVQPSVIANILRGDK